jgi:hypothetical protein
VTTASTRYNDVVCGIVIDGVVVGDEAVVGVAVAAGLDVGVGTGFGVAVGKVDIVGVGARVRAALIVGFTAIELLVPVWPLLSFTPRVTPKPAVVTVTELVQTPLRKPPVAEDGLIVPSETVKDGVPL